MKKLSKTEITQIAARVTPLGMEILGTFTCNAGEAGVICNDNTTRIGLMIANCGPPMWSHFENSTEFGDGKDDPLNRWSARVLGNVANDIGAKLVLPFEKPYAPFQQWAIRARGLSQSPLGILIHPKYGLWFGLRGALFFPADEEIAENFNDPAITLQPSDICAVCVDKPCLRSCPVGAFGDDGLNVNSCFSHLDAKSNPDCMARGCAARAACPVGHEYGYETEQLRFHMRAFRG